MSWYDRIVRFMVNPERLFSADADGRTVFIHFGKAWIIEAAEQRQALLRCLERFASISLPLLAVTLLFCPPGGLVALLLVLCGWYWWEPRRHLRDCPVSPQPVGLQARLAQFAARHSFAELYGLVTLGLALGLREIAWTFLSGGLATLLLALVFFLLACLARHCLHLKRLAAAEPEMGC